MNKQEYTILVSMERYPQIRDRILHIFSRKNIDLKYMKVSPLEQEWRQLTIVFFEEELTVKKIINQVKKQVGVISTSCFVKSEILIHSTIN